MITLALPVFNAENNSTALRKKIDNFQLCVNSPKAKKEAIRPFLKTK